MNARTLKTNENAKLGRRPLGVKSTTVKAFFVGAVLLEQQELAARLRVNSHALRKGGGDCLGVGCTDKARAHLALAPALAPALGLSGATGSGP